MSSLNTPPRAVYVRVTKMDDLGTIPKHDIFTGYTVKGYLSYPNGLPEPSKVFSLLRTSRNGKDVLGIFTTSAVQEVATKGDTEDGKINITFNTRNSRYHLVSIDDEDLVSP